MKLLALDISTSLTGFALYENGALTEYGGLAQKKYKGHSRDKYPKKTSKFASIMAEQINELVRELEPDAIVIEEVCLGGRAGIKQVKGLIQCHGVVLHLIQDFLDVVKLKSPSSNAGWRKQVGLKKNGDWKDSAVNLANEKFNLELVYDEHDVADAILLGLSEVE